MKIEQKHIIEDFNGYGYNDWMKILELGYLIYRPLPNKIVIQNANNFEIIKEHPISENSILNQESNGNRIFISIDGNIYELDLFTHELILLYKSNEEYAGVIFDELNKSDLYYYSGTYKRKPRIIRYSIVDSHSAEILYRTEERNFLIHLVKKECLFYSRDSKLWSLINLKNKAKIWETKIDDGIAGRRWTDVNSNCLIMQTQFRNPENKFEEHLQKRDLKTGQLIWQINNCMNHYHKLPNEEKFLGIGGNDIHIFNQDGEDERISLNMDCIVSSHLSTLHEDRIVFCSHKNNNIPIIGSININTSKIESLSEISVSETKSFRIGLDVPYKIGNKIYVRDSTNKLRTFETSE